MRLIYLFVFSLFFTGLSLSAQAQYTSKSTTTANTAKTTQTSASSAYATKNTNTSSTGSGLTTTSQTSTAQSNARPQKQQQTRAVFRPRPQPVEMPEAEEDDELPSFDALEKPASQQQTAQQAAAVPPPPPPKGEIWFYITDGTYRDLTGHSMNCRWKVVLQNKTDTKLKEMDIVYTLFGRKNPLSMGNLEPNEADVRKHGMYSQQCPAINQTKPKFEIVSCELGPIKDQDCMKYVVIK